MTTRPRRRFWLKLAAGLLFAVVAYGGAYAAVVKPRTIWPGTPVAPGDFLFPSYGRDYSPESRWIERFFAPAHFVDRRFRADVWHIPMPEPKRWYPP